MAIFTVRRDQTSTSLSTSKGRRLGGLPLGGQFRFRSFLGFDSAFLGGLFPFSTASTGSPRAIYIPDFGVGRQLFPLSTLAEHEDRNKPE